MSDARSKVLEMLANGKISVEESSRLLDALGSVNSESTTETVDDTVFEKFSPVKKKPKWLKIQIKELNGETIRVDTGCIVGFTSGIDYSIERAGNLKSMFFGGEGLFLATLKGKGKIYLQLELLKI